jgi:uncharacterized protein YdaU (DUF1376 family)
MSNELHTMPLKVEKFLSSARVRMMKWDEKGAYLLLLAEAWLTGGKLENDKENIRRLLNVSEDAIWKRIEKFVLSAMFEPSEDGRWLVNPSQQEIFQETLERHELFKESGRKGGYSKAKGRLEPASSNQIQSQNQNQREEVEGSAAPPPGSLKNETENRRNGESGTGKKSEKWQQLYDPGINEPSARDVQAYAESIGYAMTPEEAQKFIDTNQAAGWQNKHNNAIRDWRPLIRIWKINAKRFQPRDADGYVEPKPLPEAWRSKKNG